MPFRDKWKRHCVKIDVHEGKDVPHLQWEWAVGYI